MTSFRESSKTQVTERDKSIYMYKIGAFLSASHNLRFSACLFHKVPVRMYNVKPDKISRIMYLMSLVARAMKNEPLHEKTCLSGLASLKKQVDLLYVCADPEIRTSSPWKFTSSILTSPPPLEKLDPLPCKMLDHLWNFKKIYFS